VHALQAVALENRRLAGFFGMEQTRPWIPLIYYAQFWQNPSLCPTALIYFCGAGEVITEAGARTVK
jgi:hypothetical protein